MTAAGNNPAAFLLKRFSYMLIEGRDYYIEKGKYVFTAFYLNSKGYCCCSGCRHCHYNKEDTANADFNALAEITEQEESQD